MSLKRPLEGGLLALFCFLGVAHAQTNVYSTANVYTNVAPLGTGWMRGKLWGAGGGNGNQLSAGGGGAFAATTMAASPGDTYVTVVGQRGAPSANSLGGAGSGDAQGGAPGYLGDYNGRGQGGQATSLLQFSSNLFVLKALAGAGGGAGYDANGGPGGFPGVTYGDSFAGLPGFSGTGGSGGGTGNPGANYASNAATAGFAALNQAGGNGGDASNWSGGGGGGYGGGGGGGGGSGGNGAGGGGGGSYGQTTLPGNGTQPGNTSDSDYVAGAGTAQNDGLAVLIFAPCGPLSVVSIGLRDATVVGSLNPNNLPGAWYIDYGPTTNYGNATPPQSVSAGTGTILVSQTLTNLASSTLYHYRLVLTNSSGVASAVDSTFITEAPTTSYVSAGVYTNFAPLGTTGVTFKLWGAGGGGGSSGAATGGGGAFSTVTLPAQAGDNFLIVVGQRGASSDHNLGGNGTGDTEGGAPGYLGDYNGRGQGGQSSSVFRFTNNLLVLNAVAGGGGGSGYYAPGGAGGQSGANYVDAIGGQPGANGVGGAGGAIGSAGGNYAAVATLTGIPALSLAGGNGGDAANWSGGGGGGYGGGGGGGGGSGGNGAGGGGGGSYGDQVIPGNGQQPPNTSDTNYIAGAGQGGSALATGNDGLAVVLWHLVAAGTSPTLTSQPQSQILPTGATAIFSVTATGIDPLSYQWTFNGTNIFGATQSILVIPNVQSNNAGVYQVAVSDQTGTTLSDAATLDVLPVLLADYTFDGTGNDAVSNSLPMQLSNTEFVNGTLFLNGLYELGDTNGFRAIAMINGFSYNSFTVALDFNPIAFGPEQNNILMGGVGYRWLGYDYSAGHLEVTWNNHQTNHVFANSVVVTNQWQKLVCSVDLVNDRIITFLNGTRLEDIVLPPGFQFNVQGTPNEPNEKNFTFTDYANGQVFYGYADNLMVFGGALSATEIATLAGGPPVLLTQPQSQVVPLGGTAQFSVLAAGPVPLSYQWLFNGAAISSATNTSYTLANVQSTDQGVYQAVVANSYGSSTSSPAVLILQAPPVIVVQPQSLVVAVGAPAALSVVASGTEPLSYQWYFNGVPLSGATSSTLAFANAYFGNGGHYQVIVANDFGSAASAVATLSVVTTPIILQPPDSAQVAVGDSAVFTVLASSSAALNYQWFLEGSLLSGATQSSFTLTNAQFTDAGNYSVLVSNIAGAVLSPDATLLVLPAVAPPPVLATYTVQMQTGLNLIANQLDRGGNTLAEILPVVPDGTIVSKYDNLNGIWGQATYSNSWGPAGILSLNPGEGAWLRSPTNFSATFLGTPHTSNIPLSIPAGATWLVSSQTNAPGTYETIVGSAPAPGATVFQWLNSNATFAVFTYTITGWPGGIEPVAQVGESLWIAPTGGEPVPTPVRPLITQQPSSLTVGLGIPASFTVAASGTQPLNYQWRLNGNAIPGATTTILSIDSVLSANAGNYDVVVNNAIGITGSAIATLTISNLVTLPFADDFENAGTLASAPAGTGFGQNVGATLEPGEPTPLDLPGGASVWLTWQAPADGLATFTTAGSDFDTIMAAYTLNGSLSISNLAAVAADDDSAAFLCSLINFNASAGTTYFLQVDGYHGATGEIHLSWSFVPTDTTPPVILTQPQSATVVAGSNLTLLVVVQQGPPVSYQWFSNNIVMPGETNSTLQLNPAQVGIYVVGITNSLTGAGLFSAAADIQVIIPGPGQRGNPVFVHSEDKFLAATDLTPPDPNVPHDPATASGFTDTQTFSTVNATADPSEPAHCGYAACKSVWNSYSNQVSGTLTIDTRGTTFDAILEVYTGPGDSFATLVPVACSANHGAAGESVTFPANGGTTYWVVVDGVNCASGNVTLNYNLVATPTFTASPVSRTVAAGSQLTLSGTVVGAPTLRYQWRFNGANIAGATGSSLTLTSFQAANQGNYSVVCVNSYGSVTSLTAQVLLNNPRFINTFKSGSALQTTFVGISYTNYIIEASSNLATWFPIKTNSSAIGVFNFTDPLPLGQPSRFYRSRQR